MIRDIQTLLLRFGILGRCSTRAGYGHCRISATPSLRRFQRHIGVLPFRKRLRLEALCARTPTHDSTDVVPLPMGLKRAFGDSLSSFSVHDYVARGNNIGRVKLGGLLESDGAEDFVLFDELRALADSDI